MTENTLNELRFASIEENLKIINENIASSALKSGRKAEDIRLMAVTKTVEPVFINHALSLGINLIGENKVQEFLSKKDELNLDGVEKHLIGHLQSNKVKKIITEVDMIQSADSISIVREINRQSKNADTVSDILLEINIGGEESKTGLDLDLFDETVGEISEMENIRLKGLMCVPPVCDEKKKLMQYFDTMYKLFVDIGGKKHHNIDTDILSMGMSSDYEIAIECGSNLVRIGSALFGMRNYR